MDSSAYKEREYGNPDVRLYYIGIGGLAGVEVVGLGGYQRGDKSVYDPNVLWINNKGMARSFDSAPDRLTAHYKSFIRRQSSKKSLSRDAMKYPPL